MYPLPDAPRRNATLSEPGPSPRPGPGGLFGRIGDWGGRHPFLVGAVAAGVSAAVTAGAMAFKFPHFAGWPGSPSFSKIARHLVEDGYYSSGSSSTIERTPLYPLILAAERLLAGANWRWMAVALNGAAFSLCGGFAARLCGRLHRSPAAIWACALLLALHPVWSIEALAFRETVWFALLVISLASVLAHSSLGAGRLLLGGALAGAAYLCRPTGFLVIAVLPFWLWAARRAIRLPVAWAAAAAFVPALAPVALWQGYALRTVGHFVLSNTEGGNTALKGAIPEFWRVTPWADLDLLDPLVVRLAERAGAATPAERDRLWRDEALAAIRARPFDWLAKGLVKDAEMLSPVATPVGYGVLVPDGDSWRISNFRWDPWAFSSVPATLLILGGAALRMKKLIASAGIGRCIGIGTLLLLGAFFALHFATSGETRYRLPFDPLLAVIAAPAVAAWAVRLLRPAAFAPRRAPGT